MRAPRVGVALIVRRGDELLLIRREGVHGSGTWSTPGGHLDPGETPEACARREAAEETGVEVGDVRFRAITNDLFESERRHYITIWLEGDHVSGEPVVGAPHEMSEVAWFSARELPEPLFLSLGNLVTGRCLPPERGGLERHE